MRKYRPSSGVSVLVESLREFDAHARRIGEEGDREFDAVHNGIKKWM